MELNAQKIFSFGESHVCSRQSVSYCMPHILTLWWLTVCTTNVKGCLITEHNLIKKIIYIFHPVQHVHTELIPFLLVTSTQCLTQLELVPLTLQSSP
jgi:hypothetical protein